MHQTKVKNKYGFAHSDLKSLSLCYSARHTPEATSVMENQSGAQTRLVSCCKWIWPRPVNSPGLWQTSSAPRSASQKDWFLQKAQDRGLFCFVFLFLNTDEQSVLQPQCHTFPSSSLQGYFSSSRATQWQNWELSQPVSMTSPKPHEMFHSNSNPRQTLFGAGAQLACEEI